MYQSSFIYCSYLIESFWCLPYSWCKKYFLHLFKAFDKVWYEWLIYKLKTMGVSDSLTKLFQSFLANRFQRVLLNDHTLEWLAVKASVPQGSILRPLFFVIYINDLSKNIESTVNSLLTILLYSQWHMIITLQQRY